ncbi:MAG: PIN domain-containing protein [Gammaproteobacteria bacterium]|nr:MAG: PIN domain-containing protein [Gammaproteobacteria bacterium]
MRLFLDANILFTAAHNPKGKAFLVIELGSQGYWELFSSPYALEEARRNLERKFPRSLGDLGDFQHGIRLIEHLAGLGYPEGLAQKDQPIFQAALACQTTHLITGDLKDFGPFMNQPENTFGVCIQTVAKFLNHLG